MSRAFLRLLATVATAAAAATSAASATPVNTDIQWVDCAHNVPLPIQQQFNVSTWEGEALPALPETLACGRLNVPLDYSRPISANNTISIGFAINRPKNPKALLCFNPGGPAIEVASYAWLMALNITIPAYLPGVLDQDLLAIDVRGSYQSNPINCSVEAALALPFTIPTNASEFANHQKLASNLGRSCIENSTPPGILAHIGTEEVVRDWNQVRVALGYEKMNFVGLSYGSYGGAEYASRFPNNVGSFVLDAIVPHGMPIEDSVASQFKAVNRLLLRADAYCLYDTSCPFHTQGKGAVPTAFDTVVKLAENGSFAGVTAAEAKVMLYYYLTGSTDFPFFNLVLSQALAGDGTALKPVSDIPLSYNHLLPVFCAEEGVSDPSWKHFEKVIKKANKVDIAGFDYSQRLYVKILCSGWPIPARKSRTLSIKKPIVLVTSDYDMDAPTEWATFQWAQAPNSTLIVRHGDGHQTIILPGQPAWDAEVTYIRTGVRPSPTEQRLVSVYGPVSRRPAIQDPYAAPIGPDAGDQTSE